MVHSYRYIYKFISSKGEYMRILKSTTLVLVIIMLIISIYNLNVGLPILFFCFGLKEFVSGKELYDEQKYKLAIL